MKNRYGFVRPGALPFDTAVARVTAMLRSIIAPTVATVATG